MENSFIRFDKVSFFSEEYEVLKSISVSIPKNRCTVILGGSGSGKSTFLKVAAGIYPPDDGSIIFEGGKLLEFSYNKTKEFRKRSGFVFQDAALWANRTVFQNLALPLQFHFPKLSKEEVEKKILPLLERFDFADSAHLRPAQLSTGERKAAAFLRAIVTEPENLFLDEPTQSMDHHYADKVLDVIKEMKAQSRTMVIVTNDSRVTSMYADYLIILHDGAVVEAGIFDSVKNTRNPAARELLERILGKAASYDTDILDLLNE